MQAALAKAKTEATQRRLTEITKRLTVADLVKRYKDDFDGFCGILDIVPNEGELRKLTPLMSTQRLRNETRTARDVILKPRRVGITSIEVARDLWFWLVRPGAQVAIVCQSVTDHAPRNSLSRMIAVMLDSIRAAGYDLRFEGEAVNRWQLAGNSAVLQILEAGASEKAATKLGRGGAVHRLHVTELAFFEYAQQSLNAIIDCVPHERFGSEIVLESTANGAAGYFFEQYRDAAIGKSAFKPLFLRWFDNDIYRLPLLPGEVIAPENDREAAWMADGVERDQIKWYRDKLREKKRQDLVDQEFPADPETCFLVSGRLYFDGEVTKSLHLKTREPIAVYDARGEGAFKPAPGAPSRFEPDGRTLRQNALFVWAEPVAGRRYAIAADPSEGTGGDPGAAVVYDLENGEHIATLHGQFPTWRFGELLGMLGFRYNRALVIVERNNHGIAVLDALQQHQFETPEGETVVGYSMLYVSEDEKPGWYSTDVRRGAALDKLEDGHRTSAWSTPDAATTGELLTFVVVIKNGNAKAQAASGAHDDLVMAHAVAWHVISGVIAPMRLPPPRAPTRWGNRGRGF